MPQCTPESSIDFSGCFFDQRLSRRAQRFVAAIIAARTVVINKIATTWAEQMACYRFLHNDNVDLANLKEGLLSPCQTLVAGQHLLVFQDTTQLNYQANAPRIKPNSGLGVIGDNRSLGFFLHPSLVLDAEQEYCLGFSEIALWTRPADTPDKYERHYKALPIEAKESYRWIESIEKSKRTLDKARQITAIADRQGDIYSLFARLADTRTHLLIRSRDTRRIAEGKLYEYLSALPCGGSYTLEVHTDARKPRQGRQAHLEVRFGPVTLLRGRRGAASDPEQVLLYGIEARECAETVPEGEQPIHWRLLTTHRVDDVFLALACIYWYSLRWYIEQLFRLLKRKGLNVEASPLERGESLKKLCVLALGAVLDVMRMLLARERAYEQPLGHLFSEAEQACLRELGVQLEGGTEKQQNPHAVLRLGWASWIIARLGGWKGYRSQRPPGPITYHEGLKQFAIIFRGWCMAKEAVYNP